MASIFAGRFCRVLMGAAVGLCLLSCSEAMALAASSPPAPAPATQPVASEKPENPYASLHWQKGPCTADLGAHATIAVPSGYAFLAPQDAKKFLELNQNPVGPTHHYILTPDSGKWFIDFSFDPIGYVKDDQKVDPAAILQTLQQANDAANRIRAQRGWTALSIVGWKYPPHYSRADHRLEWAILAASEGKNFVNCNTRILGRSGVMSALLVDNPRHLTADIAAFNRLLGGFHYVSNQRYAAYKTGDKIAEYGLAALITGGAAVAVAKTGLLAVLLAKLASLWKLIAVGCAAVAAYMRRLFGRRKKSS